MQPDRTPQHWRQPDEHLPQSPYVAPVEPPVAVGPVVTMSTEEDAAAAQQLSPAAPTNEQFDEYADDPATAPDVDPLLAPVRWQGTEYIHREKSPAWFVIFAIICVILILLAIFVIQSVTFAILIPVMAGALLVYAKRPPRLIDYTLSRQGLHVNDRLYSFGEFKSFGVIHGDDEYSVFLVPIKRFKPGVTVYFSEAVGEAIVDMLAARLPMQELHLDIIDRIIRKLRI